MEPQHNESHKKPRSHALKGLKIVDFSWLAAAPFATKYLGDHGATVIKIESMLRPDEHRVFPPMVGSVHGINRSALFALYNSSKYSMSLNLNHAKGREIAVRLAAWSDIVVENFTAGTMEKWELGYDDLTKVNPDIIVVRVSLQGQTGPYAGQAGVGTSICGIAGFAHLTGWPDGPPVGTSTPYTDFVSPWYVAATIMAALDRRDRVGRGACIDLSQFEAGVCFLAPIMLDCAANGRMQTRMGNRHPHAAPHGAYRCKGDDRWCAIAVFSEDEWRGFCSAIGNPEWSEDAKFATLSDRKENEEELDGLVEGWTIQNSREEVVAKMQAHGVPAGIVNDARDICDDPQLKHRNHFQALEHPEMGMWPHERPSFRLSKTPDELRRAPCLGEDTEYVCTQILQMSDGVFAELLNAGVFQ